MIIDLHTFEWMPDIFGFIPVSAHKGTVAKGAYGVDLDAASESNFNVIVIMDLFPGENDISPNLFGEMYRNQVTHQRDYETHLYISGAVKVEHDEENDLYIVKPTK